MVPAEVLSAVVQACSSTLNFCTSTCTSSTSTLPPGLLGVGLLIRDENPTPALLLQPRWVEFVMMTVKPYTILIHAVISARNMRAILELTFHLFLTIVFFLVTSDCFPFSCISTFILSLGFPQSLSYYLFLELLFPRKPSSKLNSFCGTASVSFWELFTAPLNPIHCFLVIFLFLDLISHIAGARTQITLKKKK